MASPNRTRTGPARQGVNLFDLAPFTTLIVKTCNSVYRVIVVRGTRVVVQGGAAFRTSAIGRLSGSGLGGSLLKRGWIGVGLRMEICSDGRRVVTSSVRNISVNAD